MTAGGGGDGKGGVGSRGLLAPEFLKRLEVLDFAARKVFSGQMAGSRRSASRFARGTLFREHRPMTPGDDLRYVDWNVYARLRVAYVKEFEPEEDLEVAVFLDGSASMSFGEPEKFGYARGLAAALAFVALRRLEGVRIVPCGAGGAPPRAFHGAAEVTRAFRHIAALGPSRGGERPIDALRAVSSGLRARGLAVLVSDFYDPEWTGSALALLRHRRFRIAALHVVAPQELSPGLAGRARLRDAETGRSLPVDARPEVIEAYRSAFTRHIASVERSCRRHEAGYARLLTNEPFETALVRIVKSGNLLR